MATITYKRDLTGKEFEITSENFKITGRILRVTASNAIDSLTGHIARIGGNFHVGVAGFQNGEPIYRFDDYITSEEVSEVAAAVSQLIAPEE